MATEPRREEFRVRGSTRTASTRVGEAPRATHTTQVASDEERWQQLWGAGWRLLRGYDYFDAAEDGPNPLAKAAGDVKGALGGATPLFVVQADKAVPPGPDAPAGALLDAALWNASLDLKRPCRVPSNRYRELGFCKHLV